MLIEELKALSTRALEFVPDGSRIGLGSGRTAEAFLLALAERVRAGLRVAGVPTSEAVARRARELGIPLASLDSDELLHATIDGADEVEIDTLNLIKGRGGALVRERVVAAASRCQIILVTHEKLVQQLGARGILPVEVLPFAAPFCRRRIEQLTDVGSLKPELRGGADHPFVTDNGNWIFECTLEPQKEPARLDQALRRIPGVVDTGLFLGTANMVLVAEGKGVREMRRP